MLFSSEEFFDQNRDDSRFLSWVESLGMSQDSAKAFEATRCTLCKQIPTIVYSDPIDKRYHYGLRFICGTCQTFWNICKCCDTNNQPSSFTTLCRRQMRQYSRMSISDIVTTLDDSLVQHCHIHNMNDEDSNNLEQSEDQSLHSNEDNLSHPAIESNIHRIVVNLVTRMFGDVVLSDFDNRLKEAVVERETTKKYPDYLIKRFWLNNTNCQLHSDEVLMFLRHLRLISEQSRDENNELSSILSSMESIHHEKYRTVFSDLQDQKKKLMEAESIICNLRETIIQNGLSRDIINTGNYVITDNITDSEQLYEDCFVHLRLPTSPTEVRRILESRQSLISNILIPPIHFDEDGISWVKPSDVLKMSVCLGVPFEVVSGSNYDKDSLHSRSVYRSPAISGKISESGVDDDVVTVVYGFWSDGCYCGTESKGRRNQAKVGTIHIAHHQVTERHVFPIYFGRKEDNDEAVKKLLINDMEELSRRTILCYIPSIRQVRKVRFLLGYAIFDRIEYAKITCFMGPTGKCSRVTMVSCPISTDRGERNSPYSLCKALSSCRMCWNERVESMSRGMFHETYRSRRCRDCYDWNINSVEYYVPTNYPLHNVDFNEHSTMHHNVIKSKTITFQSMKEACVVIFEKVKKGDWNQSITELYAKRECIREAVWRKVWRSAKDLSKSPPEVVAQTSLDETTLPCFWNQRLLPLEDFHLGIMHYLFLNVGKHLLDLISMRMSELGLWSSIHSLWNTYLIGVRRLGLSWCKAWSLGSTALPGSMWVSENYVAFSILSKSISSLVYLDDGALGHVPKLREVLDTYYTLCAVVMSPIEPDERHHKYASCLAKCFLSIVTDYSLSIQRHKINKIESTSCFINLVNIGERMKEYGVMRNFWEGGYRGEGIFRPMKGLINRGLHSDKISLQTLRKQYRRLAINDLIRMKEDEEGYVSLLEYEMSHQSESNPSVHSEEDDVTNTFLTDNADRYRRFHCYKTVTEAQDAIERKEVLAITHCTSNNNFYVFVGHRKRVKKLSMVTLTGEECIGKTYVSHVTISNIPIDLEEVSTVDKDYIACMMLPLHHIVHSNDGAEVKMKYFIVNEEHQERKADGTFAMPNVYLEEKEDVIAARNVPTDEMMASAYDICMDRDKCMQFLNRRVHPNGDLPFGKVTHFKYLRSIVSVDTSLWTIKYYVNQDCTGNARKQEAIGYFEMINRLIDE